MLVEDLLLHMLAIALEVVELVVLGSVKYYNCENHKNQSLGHSVKFNDALRHFSRRDLLLKVDELLRLTVGAVRGAYI